MKYAKTVSYTHLPYFLQLQNAANTYAESFEYKHTILSYIGRINYNYDDRYLFAATCLLYTSKRKNNQTKRATDPNVKKGAGIEG